MKTLTLALLLCGVAGPALAGSQADAPFGADPFCGRNPSYCYVQKPVAAPLSAMATLQRINGLVNDKITPAKLDTPEAKLAENRNWRSVTPGGVGGCVEYAATKYELLAWEGVPLGAMRLAQVRTAGNLHMVLLVSVGSAVVVLDNLTYVIWPADMTQYNWVTAQDPSSVTGWSHPEGAPK